VPQTSIGEKRMRAELKIKRRLLFEQYLQNPLQTQLALEIKKIDDQVADFVERLERRSVSRKTGQPRSISDVSR
jgi:hypothetical protein